jgi:ATP-dependent Clp protease, protease subunit
VDSQYWIPTVGRQGQYLDIYSSMLAKGIIFVNAPIDQRIAGLIMSSLLYIYETADIVQPKLYLNTKNGDILAAMSVVDVMHLLTNNKKNIIQIQTVGFGEIGVASALILAAGSKGLRRASARSQLELFIGKEHLELGNISSADAKAREELNLRKSAVELFAKFTGKSIEEIRVYINSESFFDSQKAVDLGLVDGII